MRLPNTISAKGLHVYTPKIKEFNVMTMSKKSKFSVVISLVLCMSILFSGTVFASGESNQDETTTEDVYFAVNSDGSIELYINKYDTVVATQLDVEYNVETETPFFSEKVKITAAAFSDNVELVKVRVTGQTPGQPEYGQMVLFETGSLIVDVHSMITYIVRVSVRIGNVSAQNPGTISLLLETL